jgi:hypothetical protein
MLKELKQLQYGIYDDAAMGSNGAKKKYVSLSQHLEAMARKGDISESLLKLDERPVNSQGRALSATEQLLAHSGVTLGGLGASSVGVFIRGSTDYVAGAEVLFPALMQEVYERKFLGQHGVGLSSKPSTSDDPIFTRAMRAGFINDQKQAPLNQITIDDLVSLTSGIDGDGYRSAILSDDVNDSKYDFSRVAERAEMPVATLDLATQNIDIFKYGRRVNASYEVLRRMTINKLAILLERIASRQKMRELNVAIAVAVNGDGNGNAATSISGPNTIAGLDNWTIDLAYDDSATINMAMANKAVVKTTRALRYPAGGGYPTPDQLAMFNGAGFTLPDSTPLKLVPKTSILANVNALVGFDTNEGLERVVENGSQIEETWRFITNQTRDFVMSINIGFAKMYPRSFKRYDIV